MNMGTFAFKMPDIGEGVVEGEVVEWMVAVGDIVKEDDPILSVMTDKATVEIPSPVDGKVTRVVGEAGDTLPVGVVCIEFEVEGDGNAASSSDAPTPAPEPKAESNLHLYLNQKQKQLQQHLPFNVQQEPKHCQVQLSDNVLVKPISTSTWSLAPDLQVESVMLTSMHILPVVQVAQAVHDQWVHPLEQN